VPTYTYPMTYDSPFGYIGKNMDDANGVPFCETCSFRPWATTGRIASATVTVERRNGSVQKVTATRQPDGSWRAPVTLFVGDRAYVDRGGVVDEYGEINGERSTVIEGAVKRATTLSLTAAKSGGDTILRSRLLSDTGAGLSGETVRYLADGVVMGAATTDSSGAATFVIPRSFKSARTYTARFEGTALLLPSSASAPNPR
jgi:hypothetical protein